MARKPETRLQKRTQALLRREVGGWWFKVWGGPFQVAGIPDLVGCCGGYFFAFELKMPGQLPSVLQIEIMRRIVEDGGGIARVIYDPQEAVDAVKKRLGKAGRSPALRR